MMLLAETSERMRSAVQERRSRVAAMSVSSGGAMSATCGMSSFAIRGSEKRSEKEEARRELSPVPSVNAETETVGSRRGLLNARATNNADPR